MNTTILSKTGQVLHFGYNQFCDSITWTSTYSKTHFINDLSHVFLQHKTYDEGSRQCHYRPFQIWAEKKCNTLDCFLISWQCLILHSVANITLIEYFIVQTTFEQNGGKLITTNDSGFVAAHNTYFTCIQHSNYTT